MPKLCCGQVLIEHGCFELLELLGWYVLGCCCVFMHSVRPLDSNVGDWLKLLRNCCLPRRPVQGRNFVRKLHGGPVFCCPKLIFLFQLRFWSIPIEHGLVNVLQVQRRHVQEHFRRWSLLELPHWILRTSRHGFLLIMRYRNLSEHPRPVLVHSM